MLEDQVAFLLQKYLGNYVRGLSKEALSISVWRGDVELTNMQLKPEALSALKLPVRVKAGFLGSVKLKVPWSRLGQEPVLVYLDRIFILAEPSTQVEGSTEEAIQEAKRQIVREMEMKLLESHNQLASDVNTSWLGSFISTVIGNIKLSITNIHIRYEDTESNPGHPFAAGLVLKKLSAVTIDDSGKETFVTGGALERIQKSVELESLAIYFNSDTTPWTSDKGWGNLRPSEWNEIFDIGIVDNRASQVRTKESHKYILQPVSGNAKYTKLRLDEAKNLGQALQQAAIYLNDVTLSLSKEGYRDMLKMADNFSSFNQRLRYVHYRPSSSIKSDPRSWWKYAYKVVNDELKKTSGKMSWDQLLRYARLRKKYVPLYASLLKSDTNQLPVDDSEELKGLDRQLDPEVILQWRMLAHKFVEQSTEIDRNSTKQRTRQRTRSPWWSFGWSNSDKDELDNKGFTNEDWERLNKVIGYKESNNEYLSSEQEKDLMQFCFEIHMRHNASKLITDDSVCLADLSCEEFRCNFKLYSEAKVFSLNIQSYRLLSPNGVLAESACLDDSFVGIFSYKPLDEEVDWSFSAKASPCYVTYLKESVDQIVAFFKSSPTVSQTLALETAAAVQTTINEVKRTAQQQVSQALKDQSRFSLKLDLAAPKITVPSRFRPDDLHATKLLLDLGHLVLTTHEIWEIDKSDEKDKYLQFNIVLSDVSAFLVDGDYSWSGPPSGSNFFPVIEKCGIALKLQQILAQSPSHPTTRVALRVPSLGFHFSPARYHRLMEVIKVFSDGDKTGTDETHFWEETDREGWIAVLTWKGVGNREPVWLRRYLRLVGPSLYIFENQSSTTYKQWLSLRGKQLHQIAGELVDGMRTILAICDSGQVNLKVYENSGALVLLCDDEEDRKVWQSRLQTAIYRSSGSAGVFSFAESPREISKSMSHASSFGDSPIETLFVVGALDELKIHFSCKYGNNDVWESKLLEKERSLIEFRAVGGQVELSITSGNILIGTLLKSLEVEDLSCYVGTSGRRFLARSFIENTLSSTEGSSGIYSRKASRKNSLKKSVSDENFFEASDDFEYFETPSQDDGMQDFLPSMTSVLKPPNYTRIPGLVPNLESSRGDFEKDYTLHSFVKAQIIIYSQSSPQYNNLDNRVVVELATLTFFCHRPTVLAIMDFMKAITTVDANQSIKDAEGSNRPAAEDGSNSDRGFGVIPQPARVLPIGKSRVIFYLTLSMDKAQIILQIENADSLATLSQNNLLTNIKVFPSSFSIDAALGNLKISDDSLPNSHPYYWICDMRNPGGSSFVEMKFSSFSAEDEDYCGYDYSLDGQLSEVKIVYLNRFVQEIISYFLGLIPRDTESVVKLADNQSISEKRVSQSDMVGSPALKLDLSLTRPIIQMPRKTDSEEFLQLDVLYITVQNYFQWLGGCKDDLRAVHLEVMTVKIKDINLTIGINMVHGESIIQDVNGFSLEIYRSLRDLEHQSPAVQASIKVEVLKAVLTNREYEIITECALSNLSESSRSIPTLDYGNGNSSENNPTPESFVPSDSSEPILHPQCTDTWVTTKFTVEMDLVELSLHSGSSRDSPFATVQATGAWLLYKSNTLEESFLFASLKQFAVTDDREGTKEELRLAIGKSAVVSEITTDDYIEIFGEALVNSNEHTLKAKLDFEPDPSMLILDAKFRKNASYVSLRVQRPKFLVALDFLVATVEFFVPSARNMLSNEDDRDLLQTVSAVVFDEKVYHQNSSIFSVSPKNPLIVDDERFDHFTYDGKGGKLYLHDRDGKVLTRPSSEPSIFIYNGKTLQFMNVTIVNGSYLDSCISLGSDSRYVVSEQDHVYFQDETADINADCVGRKELAPAKAKFDGSSELVVELQAVGPELTFYSDSNSAGELLTLARTIIHARMDLFGRLVIKNDSIGMTGNICELTMESNGVRVIEPFDASVEFFNESGKIRMNVEISEVYMNFSVSILRLFLAVEEDILAFVRMSSNKVSVMCSQFDKVGEIQRCQGDPIYAFWRPRAPSGYAILGDCFTPLNEPPSKGVLALNTSAVKVKRPLRYDLIWQVCSLKNEEEHCTSEIPCKKDSDETCTIWSIWLPIPPEGYVAVGCIVSSGTVEPPLSVALCIRSILLSPCSLKDCITLSSNERDDAIKAFWRVDNSFASFLPAHSHDLGLHGKAYDLRHMLLKTIEPSNGAGSSNIDNHESASHTSQVERSVTTSGLPFETITDFKLIWSNNGISVAKKLSIWRPVLPQGVVYFGDVAVNSYEKPNSAIALRDEDCTLLRVAQDYMLAGRIRKWRGLDGISFWYPQAPPGYSALGCIASKGTPSREDFSSLRCIRSDMVTGGQFSDASIWDTLGVRASEPFSLWSADSAVGTFVVRSGYKKPSRRLAVTLACRSAPCNQDNFVIDAKIKSFSAVAFDDYGGLMVPLFGISFDNVAVGVHGGDYWSMSMSLSLAARSYNDKHDIWEPLIEPTDGFLRYQFDPHSHGAPTQLRITTTEDLNFNVSVSNANMLSQAYASWNNLGQANRTDEIREDISSSSKSILDVTHGRHYYIIPQNKLGQDIYVRVVDAKSFSNSIRLSSGVHKSVKIPVSENFLDSYVRGSSTRLYRSMLTIIIANAEIIEPEAFGPGEYMTLLQLTEKHPVRVLQQSSRTCAKLPDKFLQNTAVVNWNEMFFFMMDHESEYLVEFIVIDAVKGRPIGTYSAPLRQIAQKLNLSNIDGSALQLSMRELLPAKHSDHGCDADCVVRIRFAAFLSDRNEIMKGRHLHALGKRSRLQISPSHDGPWTTVRLNYAAAAAALPFGNDIIVSDVTVRAKNIFVGLRSVVSVTNYTSYAMNIRLNAKCLQSSRSGSEYANDGTAKVETDEFSEFQKYDPCRGWICCDSNFQSGVGAGENLKNDGPLGLSSISLPEGWVWTDTWHVDTAAVGRADGWIYYPPNALQPEPLAHTDLNYSRRQRKWIRNRKFVRYNEDYHVIVGQLNPGSSLSLPLSKLTHQSTAYALEIKPINPDKSDEYSWSILQQRRLQAEASDADELTCIHASNLVESDNLLFCSKICGSSSTGSQGLWFCSTIESKQIGKDIHAEPIYDWNILVKSPLCLVHNLPVAAEYAVSADHYDQETIICSQGTLEPGGTVNVHTADPRGPIYLSLIPDGGWQTIHDPVPISHPRRVPSKFISLRNILSGRIVQIILEQSNENDYLVARLVSIYVPYWISCSRLPPLVLKFIDISERGRQKYFSLHSRTERNERVLWQISQEELVDGYTIASGLNFKTMGLSASIGNHRDGFTGPAKELSSLGDMDGSVDLYAVDADSRCMHVFVSSRPSSYQAVPTKVICVRPFMTFTNRIGQAVFIRFHADDETKTLSISDYRSSFYCGIERSEKLQVRLEDTHWCRPLEIIKEDTVVIAMRHLNGGQIFIRAEIRGYEEGSRFLVIFRLGPTDGPIRIENRSSRYVIDARQSGVVEDNWVQLGPLSSKRCTWDEPYGKRILDLRIHNDIVAFSHSIDLESYGRSVTNFSEHRMLLLVEAGDIMVIKFIERIGDIDSENRQNLNSNEIRDETIYFPKTDTQGIAAPWEFIVELGTVGISLIDMCPREILYFYLERVYISYLTNYDSGSTSRFKLIIGYLQLDNQLPLSPMPVVLFHEDSHDLSQPALKANISFSGETAEGVQVLRRVYIRVAEKVWRLNIHEPIIWALVDFYSNLHFSDVTNSSTVTEVDPEIRFELIDISEVRLKVAMETAPSQRPRGALGIWSPIFSAIGNAFKIQIHLRKVVHTSHFMRKSSILPAIINRIKRDLISNPLHLIFSVNVLGVTKSTFATLSKGFAELSTDGQFLQLRSKQVWSRRITGVGDGIVQGTEAFAQGVAFGVSGVVTKPVESVRQYGLIGVAHGFGRAILGFIVEPLSGALDFVSLTVDGVGASVLRCFEILNNKSVPQRIRNPRAIHTVIREYNKREAAGQMALYLAEASRHFACTDILREPSKYAWSDAYEDHFLVPYQRIVLVTNKRLILLQCFDLDKLDKKPSKILWDVPWEEVLALELAKAEFQRPSHLIVHLKNFRKGENFVRLIKCNTDEDEHESRAIRLCSSIRKMWRAHQANSNVIPYRVPSRQRYVYLNSDEANAPEFQCSAKPLVVPNISSGYDEKRHEEHTVNFLKIWSSEHENRSRCTLFLRQVANDERVSSIWRPVCPDGYVSIGDIAHVGSHPPHVAAIYKFENCNFARPIGYDLVWRNCGEDYAAPVTIWLPRPPEGYVALGCVCCSAFDEPPLDSAFCARGSIVEETSFEEEIIWASPDGYPWSCYLYQVRSEALQFIALRQLKENSQWIPKRITYASQAPEASSNGTT